MQKPISPMRSTAPDKTKSRKPRETSRGFLWLLCFFGVFCTGVSSYLFRERSAFISHAVVTEGTVIKLNVLHDQDESTDSFAPVYEFTDQRGIKRVIESGTYSHPSVYSVGERVSVLYLPESPGKAKLDSFIDLWGIPSLLIFAGLLQVGMSILLMRAIPRKARTKKAPRVSADIDLTRHADTLRQVAPDHSSTLCAAIQDLQKCEPNTCLSFEADADRDKWLQIVSADINAIYPHPDDPELRLKNLVTGGTKPEITNWEPLRYVTVTFSNKDTGAMATWANAYFIHIMGCNSKGYRLTIKVDQL